MGRCRWEGQNFQTLKDVQRLEEEEEVTFHNIKELRFYSLISRRCINRIYCTPSNNRNINNENITKVRGRGMFKVSFRKPVIRAGSKYRELNSNPSPPIYEQGILIIIPLHWMRSRAQSKCGRRDGYETANFLCVRILVVGLLQHFPPSVRPYVKLLPSVHYLTFP
jgi:hypothetical protein